MRKIALIIGAMKSGTTSLFHYLSQHPEISAAKEKEPHFFSSDQQFSKGFNWYYALWESMEPNKVALEASTTYTMFPKYPEVVKRLSTITDAEFYFIYLMRNPFTRIESHIRHLLAGRHLSQPEVTEESLSFSEYAYQLDPYVKTFGRERIHLLLLEDLEANPGEELGKICTFLNIDSTYQFQEIDLIMNSQKTLNLYPWIRRFYKLPLIKAIGKAIPPEVRQYLYEPLSRPDPLQVKLSDSDKTIILNRLTPDLYRLKDEFGVNLSEKWGISEVE
jgi:hypothetical protein